MKRVNKFTDSAVIEFIDMNGDVLKEEIYLRKHELELGQLEDILGAFFDIKLTIKDSPYPVFNIYSPAKKETMDVFISINGSIIKHEDVGILLGGCKKNLNEYLNSIHLDFVDIETGEHLEKSVQGVCTTKGVKVMRETLVDDFKLRLVSNNKDDNSMINEPAICQIYDETTDEFVKVHVFINGRCATEKDLY